MAKSRSSSPPEPAPELLPDWRLARGLDATRSALRRAVVAGTLPPVVLLVGRRGLGKTFLVAEIAATFFCATRAACGVCAACKSVLTGRHPEILRLANDGEALDVERIAAAQEHVSLKPAGDAGARIVIVEDIDRLTLAAANRWLKTLEEPPHGARFLLTSSRPQAILATVRSRTVQWRVAPTPLPELLALLPELAASRGVALPDQMDEVARLAKRAGGTVGATLTLLAQEASPASTAAAALNAADRQRALDAAALLRGVSVPDFLAAFEMELNAQYHARLATGAEPHAEARRGAARRSQLRAARAAAANGRVAVNAQLVAEGLALL